MLFVFNSIFYELAIHLLKYFKIHLAFFFANCFLINFSFLFFSESIILLFQLPYKNKYLLMLSRLNVLVEVNKGFEYLLAYFAM